MGVAFKDLIKSDEIELDFLKDKIILLDAHNILYQFLTTIRSRDGALLMDSRGNITSHLLGLFTRTTNLMQRGIKMVFVFDGEPPKLKQKTREQRKALKLEAGKKYIEAKKKEDHGEMKKYASRTTRLTKDILDESKRLIHYLGIPIVQAPSEGEAQAAYMSKKSDGYAVASQDFDSLIHGATRLVRNLSISGKRRKIRSLGYKTVKPEIINLSDTLNNLGIDQNQLIALAMIVGTDYNPGGIKGIGPKNALKFVKKYESNFDILFSDLKWNDHFEMPWTDVYYLIKKMPTTDNYKIEWKNINPESLFNLLVQEHDFSEDRIKNNLEKLNKKSSKKQQKSLADF